MTDQMKADETSGQMLQRLGTNGFAWAEEMHKHFPSIPADDLLAWCCTMIETARDKKRRTSPVRADTYASEYLKKLLEMAEGNKLELDPYFAYRLVEAFYEVQAPVKINLEEMYSIYLEAYCDVVQEASTCDEAEKNGIKAVLDSIIKQVGRIQYGE